MSGEDRFPDQPSLQPDQIADLMSGKR